jgi:carbon monoxide dehydrogenase subunit G
MKIESEFIFQGPREKVWEMLQNPEVLAAAVPGAKKLHKLSEQEYEGEMDVRIGPLQGLFAGKVVLSHQIPPESYNMLVEAKGPLGFGKGEGQVQLIAEGKEATRMKYTFDLQVGGKLASVGQRLLETVGKSLSRQSLESINQALQKPPSQVEKYSPPSQGKFAMAVARDVAGTLFSSHPILWSIVLIMMMMAIVGGIWFLARFFRIL